MITINDWKHLFPFNNPRNEQIRAINEILTAFIEENKQIVILDAATGTGKSAIAWTISRYLQQNVKVSNDDIGSWFLTTQKILQDQYIRDFSNQPTPIKSIKGSATYICSKHENDEQPLTCGEVHRLMTINNVFKKLYCDCLGNCKYKIDKKIFLEALNSVTSYSYFFAESQYARKISKRELLIADECHTIQNQLSSFIEISISERFAKLQLNIDMPDEFETIIDAFKWLKTKYLKALKEKIASIESQLEHASDEAKKINFYIDLVKKHDLLDKHVCKLNRLIKNFSEENWIFNIIPANGKSLRKLEFKPVNVSPFANDHLFSFGNKILMMSATVLDHEVFCSQLGIDSKSITYVKIDSIFKVENRPIHIMPIGSMSKNYIDETLPIITKAVKIILEQHKDDKGIIHCVSTKVAKHLIETVKDSRLITHDASNRNIVLKMHEDSKKPSVLVSPSMAEGVDLSDDKSRFQIICKVPFPYLGDKVIQKRMQNNPKWYDYMTVMSLVQMLGRSIRNENDHAVSYILDADWIRFFKRNKKMFPNDLKDAIQ